MASIKMVIGWLMEYSLRYDLTQLRSELKNLFPKLVLELKIPNEDALYRHAVLKLIESNGEGENEILDNLENLKNTIDSFEDMLEDTEFNQDPDRNLQLHDFVNKLKMIKGKYRIQILIRTLEMIERMHFIF